MDETTEMISFYQLIDPRNQQPFYIGQTIDLERRFKDYRDRPHYQSRALAQRLRELEALGLAFLMQELEQRRCTRGEATEREMYWIATLRGQGIDLLNRSNGQRGRRRQSFYLPSDLSRWLKLQAIEEKREMSEIVTEALEEYRRAH